MPSTSPATRPTRAPRTQSRELLLSLMTNFKIQELESSGVAARQSSWSWKLLTAPSTQPRSAPLRSRVRCSVHRPGAVGWIGSEVVLLLWVNAPVVDSAGMVSETISCHRGATIALAIRCAPGSRGVGRCIDEAPKSIGHPRSVPGCCHQLVSEGIGKVCCVPSPVRLRTVAGSDAAVIGMAMRNPAVSSPIDQGNSNQIPVKRISMVNHS